MFFLIGRNPLYEDLNRSSNQNMVNKQLEALEIHLKKNFEKVQDFDPDDCYNQSQNSDDLDFNDSQDYSELDSNKYSDEDQSKEESIKKESNASPLGIGLGLGSIGMFGEKTPRDNHRPSKAKSSLKSVNKSRYNIIDRSIEGQSVYSNQNGNRRVQLINEKLASYKRLIKIIDFLAAILIFFGAVLSQIDQDKYYYDNIFYRVTAVVMIHYVYNNPGNNSMSLIFDENRVNLTLLTQNSNTNIDEISNFQNFQNITGISTYTPNFDSAYTTNTHLHNTNAYFLSKLNFSEFNYTENLIHCEHIKVPLKTSSESEGLRGVILFSTIASSLLLFFSRYFEHVRDYFYKRELEIPFFKSEYFPYALMEISLILPIQYPGVNSYIIFHQLDSTICLPYTSILASISIFRFIYIIKVFKHFTIWGSDHAERKCEKYVCKADFSFAFRAMQKGNPFTILSLIFILTCVCLGFSLRNFELHYWEIQPELEQNWRYHWNALWCIFVSMTTVGYGDFYPKTHFGRSIIVLSCLIGVYFFSMMMSTLSQKSLLSESEIKAYKLITRLKLRNELKDIESNIVYHSLKMFILIKRKNVKNNRKIHRKEFEIKYNYERRCIMSLIEHKKIKDLNIKLFEFIPTKEQLFDIYTRMDEDIKEIRNEIDSLSYVNDSIVAYAESQNDNIKYLKKNIYATKLMFGIIEKKPEKFGDLADFDRGVLNEDVVGEKVELKSQKNLPQIQENSKDAEEFKRHINQINTASKTLGRRSVLNNFKINEQKFETIHDSLEDNVVNPNQFDQNFNKNKTISPLNLASQYEKVSDDEDEIYSEDWSTYNYVSAEKIKEHFNFLFLNQKDSNRNSRYFMKKNTIKTIMTIRNMKQSQVKLKSILDQKSQGQVKYTTTEDEDEKKGKARTDGRMRRKSRRSKMSGESGVKQQKKSEKNKMRDSEGSNPSKSFYS
jgi:hypothetical protein